MFAYMYVCVLRACLVSTEARKESLGLESQMLWAATWVLEINLRVSGRAPGSLNHRAVSLALQIFLNRQKEEWEWRWHPPLTLFMWMRILHRSGLLVQRENKCRHLCSCHDVSDTRELKTNGSLGPQIYLSFLLFHLLPPSARASVLPSSPLTSQLIPSDCFPTRHK